MLQRIQKVQVYMKEHGIDALFITNQNNVAYLTGFLGLTPSERECYFIITKNQAYLLTFPTYYGLYKDNSGNYKVRCITFDNNLKSHLQSIAKSHKLKKIGFESENVTVAEKDSLVDKLEVDWIGVTGAIENLRQVKDENELTHIRCAADVTDEAFAYIKRKI